MNVQINQLVRSLLQKDSIEQCSIQELQQYADKHPYFGAAQLLLAKKMKAENDEQFNNQLQKTFLFFHNPLWVENLLNETGYAKITMPEHPVTVPVNEETGAEKEIEILKTTIVEINDQAIPAFAPIEETKEPEQSVAVTLMEEENIVSEQIALEAILTIPAFKPEPFDPSKAELTFEPFHTVDYFASQGIKFKEEDKPVDKFGQQLKSFTDWLKIMKRLPVSEITKNAQTEPAIEQKVDQLAEHSLQDRDVVTEAMAEVWEKQGNTGKAIEIYSKLSLLDPLKSTYFAAKIEGLKKTN